MDLDREQVKALESKRARAGMVLLLFGYQNKDGRKEANPPPTVLRFTGYVLQCVCMFVDVHMCTSL
jgi:hypothetical protein